MVNSTIARIDSWTELSDGSNTFPRQICWHLPTFHPFECLVTLRDTRRDSDILRPGSGYDIPEKLHNALKKRPIQTYLYTSSGGPLRRGTFFEAPGQAKQPIPNNQIIHDKSRRIHNRTHALESACSCIPSNEPYCLDYPTNKRPLTGTNHGGGSMRRCSGKDFFLRLSLAEHTWMDFSANT